MFADLITAIRSAAKDSLPSGVFANDRVLYDALDNDITPTRLRVVNITSAIGDVNQVSMGSPARYRANGVLYVRLYEPNGKGDKFQLDYASSISNYLRGRSVVKNGVTIRFRAPTLANSPVEKNYWVAVVQVPFYADAFFQVTP